MMSFIQLCVANLDRRLHCHELRLVDDEMQMGYRGARIIKRFFLLRGESLPSTIDYAGRVYGIGRAFGAASGVVFYEPAPAEQLAA